MKFILLLFLTLIFDVASAADSSVGAFKTYGHPRFNKFKSVALPKLEGFVENKIKFLASKTGAVFYPFGGPDITYPLILFPQARSYLLIGLEPRGVEYKDLVIPGNLDNQLDSLFRRSFFVTADMSRIIARKEGMLPLFLAQIALMGGVVKDIKYIDYSFGKSLEIIFVHLRLDKKLIYIQTNVVNQNLNDDLLKFIKDNDLFDTCMIKAGSYLLHQDIFSKLTDFVLENAKVILQDDTGVPLKKFPKDFTIRLFGDYKRPYGIEWKGYFQKDLYKMYHARSSESGIPFCYGYGCSRSPVALILATRGLTDD